MRFLHKHTWILIISAIGLSFLYPVPGLLLSPFVSYLLMVLMFFSLLKIRMRDVVKQLKHTREIILLLLVIHIVGPVLVFFLKPFLQTELFLGLLLISAMPSGISVVFLSELFGGTPGKALPVTAISHFITPIAVPFIVFFIAGTEIEISSKQMTITLLKLIVIPYVCAFIARRSIIYNRLTHYSLVTSQVLLFTLLLGLISPLVSLIYKHSSQLPVLIIISIVMTLSFFVVSYRIGRTRKDRITFGITGSFKNFTLATVVAVSLFSPLAALPVIIYALINNVLLVPLEFFVKRIK